MSLQDDIMDVEAALEGKPEAEQFDRVHQALADFETEILKCRKVINDLRNGAVALQAILGNNND